MVTENLDRRQMRLEVIGGMTTFLTMSYIVVVNPQIIQAAGVPFSAAMTATVLLCASMTALMGLYARLPYGVAPGMGINAFFVYGLCLGQGIPWQQAFGLTFWAGVAFLALSAFRVRESIVRAIPHHLRIAAAAGIGLFLVFLGLKSGQFISANEATLLGRAPISQEAILAAIGLLVIIVLLIRGSALAMLAGIVVVTVLAAALGKISVPQQVFSQPDFSLMGQLDIVGSLKVAYVGAILGLLFTDLFDSLSTFCGVSQAAGLLDEDGQPRRLREGLITDSLATMFAGVFGTSSGTTYIESAAGIKAGAKTGIASLVTAALFVPFLFVGPLLGSIPPYATAPVLIVVGVLMLGTLSDLRLSESGQMKLERLIPAGLTLATIPLTFSITQGITLGFVSHTLCYLVAGKWREIHPVMYPIAAISLWVLIS